MSSDCDCERVDRLVEILRLHPRRPVDADEVAVLLESTGFAGRGVFALAARVRRRMGRPAAPAGFRWDWAGLGTTRLVLARIGAGLGALALGWRYGPLAVLPGLVAVPLGEVLAAWCGGQAKLAAGRYGDPRVAARHLRAVARRAGAALVPPLLVATALLAAGRYLPTGRATVAVLVLAWYPLLLLLAGGYLSGRVPGLSTGPYGRGTAVPRVLRRVLPRPRRLAQPPRAPARPAARRA